MLDLKCNEIVLSNKYCMKNNIKTWKIFHKAFQGIVKQLIRELLISSKLINLEYNRYFTEEIAVVILSL